MNPDSILNWLFFYVLEHQFMNDRREMALQLRVTERTLNKAIDEERTAETALLFEQILEYALDHEELCIDKILKKYKQAN